MTGCFLSYVGWIDSPFKIEIALKNTLEYKSDRSILLGK